MDDVNEVRCVCGAKPERQTVRLDVEGVGLIDAPISEYVCRDCCAKLLPEVEAGLTLELVSPVGEKGGLFT